MLPLLGGIAGPVCDYQCLLSTAPSAVCGGVGAGGECDGWSGAG